MIRPATIAVLAFIGLLAGCDRLGLTAMSSGPGQAQESTAAVKPGVRPPSTRAAVKYIFARLAWNVANELSTGEDVTKSLTKPVGKMVMSTINVLLPDFSNYAEEDLLRMFCEGGDARGTPILPDASPALVILNKKFDEVRFIRLTRDVQGVEVVPAQGKGLAKVKIDNAGVGNPLRIWLWCDDESEITLKVIMRPN